MVNKKLIVGLLSAAVLCTSAGVGYKQIFASINKQNVTLLKYTAAKTTNKARSFKINSLSCGEAVGFLSNNEVLILNKKSGDQSKNVTYNFSLSIYNINTGNTKEFKDVNSDGDEIKISPDKKYVLYVEPKPIPQVGSTDWQNDLKSGKLLNRSVKILNLATGETKDFKAEYRTKDANYSWIDNDKVFAYYPEEANKWNIVSIDGNVYKTGNFKAPNSGTAWPAYNVNIKVSGNDVSGNFVIEADDKSVMGVAAKATYYSVNVKTNEMKQIYKPVEGATSKYAVENNTILIQDSENSRTSTNIVGVNADGSKVSDTKIDNVIYAPMGPCYSISNDGKKVAFRIKTSNVLNDTDPKQKPMYPTSLNILDLETGKVTKVYDSKVMINDLAWSNDGTALIFNDGKQYILKIQ